MIDFHNHLIPEVDDGAANLEESIAGVIKMREQGVRKVIATPHFRASTVANEREFDAQMKRIDSAWALLVEEVARRQLDVQLARGVELAMDEPRFSLRDPRLRLAGTRFVLVEFPFFMIPPNGASALGSIIKEGATPIIAHPERYQNIDEQLEGAREWKRIGSHLQINAGSLVGAYGKRVEKLAWRFLEAGLADYLCSDFHSRGKCLLEPAKRRIIERGGAREFEILTVTNGDRLLGGISPVPPGALARQTLGLQRVLSFFRHPFRLN